MMVELFGENKPGLSYRCLAALLGRLGPGKSGIRLWKEPARGVPGQKSPKQRVQQV